MFSTSYTRRTRQTRKALQENSTCRAGSLVFPWGSAERSATRAPAATASGTVHTAPPSRALQCTAQPCHQQKPFRAKRPPRKPGAPQACGSRAPTEGAGPTSNPLPSAPQLRSSPAARDHRPPTAALRAAPGPFTAGEPEPRYLSAAPAGRRLTFILLTLDAAGKGRTSARTSYIHPATLARAVPPAPRVTGPT